MSKRSKKRGYKLKIEYENGEKTVQKFKFFGEPTEAMIDHVCKMTGLPRSEVWPPPARGDDRK